MWKRLVAFGVALGMAGGPLPAARTAVYFSTVANLPSACDTGQPYVVTDLVKLSDCSTGSGTVIGVCICNAAGTGYESPIPKPPPVCKTLFDSAGLGATDDITSIHRFEAAVTVSEVWCESDTGTPTITLEDGSGNDLTTSCSCDATGDTGNTCTLTANDSFTDGELLDFVMVTAAGNRLTFCVEYDLD